MLVLRRFDGWWERLLSFGAHPGEPASRRAKRRIIIATVWIATLLTPLSAYQAVNAGQGWVAAGDVARPIAGLLALVAIRLWPDRFVLVVNVLFVVVFASQVSETVLLGGLLPSGLVVAFGLIVVLGALVIVDLRAAMWWFAAFLGSVVFATFVGDWIDPVYVVDDPVGDAALNLVIVTSFAFAVMAYFVRQRDHYQKQSDDLLHNILPEEIAARLRDDNTMIADDYEWATVVFADVVDFTPMSAGMAATEVVGLLNQVFSTFDGYVDDLGLEKIKTVGDEYMVASGVPVPRSDHAHAAAKLALRMRDHVASGAIAGHQITLRIGLHSGPVVAGIIGTRKFSYDLWGDTVNTASRMESTGVPGSIQVSPATYRLIRDAFVCERRGLVDVKGKGEIETFFLVGEGLAER